MEKKELEIIARKPEENGWLETFLPKTVMIRLQSYIEEAKNNPIIVNEHLAGNISKSLKLKDKDNWFFKTILVPLISNFMECYPQYEEQINLLTKKVPYCLNSFWVNFQKENEFNPLHGHGGIFSFVIFVKIPTDWREQHTLPISSNSADPAASNFELRYTTMLGSIDKYSYPLDKGSEGGMLFFPSKLNHAVHPFYNCDKERISISGNVFFDTSMNK